MGTIVDASVPPGQFALNDTFDAVPDAEFETVRVVAHDADHPMPFVWGAASDQEALYDALSTDVSTSDVRRLASNDDGDLYRVEWETSIENLVSVLVDGGGTLLGALGSGERWALQVLFPDHDAISATFSECADAGMNLTIRRVNRETGSIGGGGAGLSADQHEAILAAFETDYYAVPRGMTLEALAGELNVSHQALSERLRRGHRNLIANTLFDAPEPVKRLS